jgi:signal transduction histidine kinase
MAANPEIEICMVSWPDYTSIEGQVRSELFYRTVSVTYAKPSSGANPRLAPAKPLDIQVGFSKQALESQIRQAQRSLALTGLAISVLGLLLGLGGSWWISWHLAQPISMLSGAVERMGRGDLQVAIPVSGQDETSTLARSIIRMGERIRVMIAAKDDLMSTLTHELNNPMVGLKAFLELITDPKRARNPLEVQEACQTMREAIDQMELTLSNTLELFKTADKPELACERFDLNELLQEVLRLYEPVAKANRIRLERPDMSKPFHLSADKRLLRRVIVNLFANAIKYTPVMGVIKIGVEGKADDIVLSVTDTGPGIGPEDKENIFTKFYRAAGPDGKSQRIPGTGLGLSIAKQVVDMHHGRIWVESEKGKGSIFYVSLPRSGDTSVVK